VGESFGFVNDNGAKKPHKLENTICENFSFSCFSLTFTMWNILYIFVIFILASLAQGAEVETIENTFNCYADYLKRHGMLEQNYKSEPFNGESFLCDVVLSTTVEGIYSGLLEEFSLIEDLRDSSQCIVDNLRKAKWSDIDIKEQVYEVSEALSDAEKEEKIKELKVLQNQISSDAIVNCMAAREFGGLFDQIYTKDDQEEDFVGDYCARAYAVEKKIIDTNLYQVNINPKDLITKDIGCSAINQQHFSDAEEELRQHLLKDIEIDDKKVKCLIAKYHENHYFNNTLAIAILSELNISDVQKENERNKFIQSMISITRVLSEC
jgi:hypothetical protein